MKLSQSETSFDHSIYSKRVTRSSVGSVHNAKLLKKLTRTTKNNNLTSKKEKKVNNLTKSHTKNEAYVISLDDINPPKCMIQSSTGSAAFSSSRKLPKLVSKLETKSSKQLKNKRNQMQPKSDSGKVKKPNVKATSLLLAEIDDISSLAQSDVKGKKSSKPVLKKKADEILSRKQLSRNLKKNQSVDMTENSSVTLIQRRVTRSSLGNVNSLSIREVNPKNKPASPVVKVAEKPQTVKKTQASKEEQSVKNEDSKRNTRSSLGNKNSPILPRNKSTRSKTKPNPKKQIKAKLSPEKEKFVSESLSSESPVVCSVSTRSSAKKAVPKNPLPIQRVSRSWNLSNTSVLSPSAKTSQIEDNMLKNTTARNTRLSESILPISASSSSGTRRTASLKSKPSLALETKEKNPIKSKKPRGVKRKSDSPPAVATKRKRNTPSITPTSTQDLEPSQSTSTDRNAKKHARRHTVDALPKNKGPKNSPNTHQKEKKATSDMKGKSAGQTAAKNSSRSTPDISILPLDAISTFTTSRPKSAPAAMKKQSLPKDLAAIPRKGTLKRKRWLSEALKEKNHAYEDDIFENQKFATPFRLPTEADEESDTSIATPKFGFFLTPAVAKRTPKFKDIISPSNLVKARKNAEEYLYRRQNRNKTNKVITLITPASSQHKAPSKLGQIPEKKKLEFAEAMDKIQTIKSTIEAKAAEESDDEEDNYLSDLST